MARDNLELERPEPQRTNAPDLERTEGSIPQVEERSYDTRLAAFEESISDLRTEYEPFLRNLTPSRSVKRDRSRLEKFEFRYETAEDRGDFNRVLTGEGDWESTTVPDFRGPVGEWTGFYRTTFELLTADDSRHILRFEAADYVARVYLNGRCLGEHEGIFGPFEFDVTEALWEGENVLVVEIENEETMLGSMTEETGDKICSSNGPGWDEPGEGWHNCPPGAGIHAPVVLEQRPGISIQDLYAETDGGSINANVEIQNALEGTRDIDVRLDVYPKNFDGEAHVTTTPEFETAGKGVNRYSWTLTLEQFRRWSPDEPWLYQLRATLLREGVPVDQQTSQFGIRDFEMVEINGRKGNYLLNGDPIYLRGTNEMGNLKRSVMADDHEQLVEDLLIAKNANINFLRFTQRPVPKTVSRYCDMLGIVTQSDLPMFGRLRYNQLSEALKQVSEMGHLIRGHPSSVQVSFMNEPHPVGDQNDRHRFFDRGEVETFFDAARDVVTLTCPECVVKNVDGDLAPPTGHGITDFHTYNMWYTNQEISIGELHRGYLPEVKSSWQVGCGEYGAEGLDNISTMFEHYPEEWLPDDDEPWSPRTIPFSQTPRHHGDWYEKPDSTIDDWVTASQRHQALAVEMMTDALRRRGDLVVSNAIHLLIDAWPAGWGKTLVDYSRQPKPAYFAYQDALEPVRIDIKTDQFACYHDVTPDIEVWTLNDQPKGFDDYRLEVCLRVDGKAHERYSLDGIDVPASGVDVVGTVQVDFPTVDERTVVSVEGRLLDKDGNTVHEDRLEIEVFPRPTSGEAKYLGDSAKTLLSPLPLRLERYEAGNDFNTLFVASPEALETHQDDILEQVADGSRVVLLGGQSAVDCWTVDGSEFRPKTLDAQWFVEGPGLTFLARNEEHSLTDQFEPDDFKFVYNDEEDRIDFLAKRYVETNDVTSLLYTYKKEFSEEIIDLGTDASGKERQPVVGQYSHGAGDIVVSELLIKGRLGRSPVLDEFHMGLLMDP